MTTDLQIQIANRILESGVVQMVFHSVQLLRNEKNQVKYPAYPKGGEFTYAGIDDTHGLFAYIRINGDMLGNPFKLTSCSGSHAIEAPLRVVFFNDNEDRNQEELLSIVSNFLFLQHVKLVRIITDKFRLVADESPMFRENFDGKTFYVAFDIMVKFIIKPNDCEPEKCIIHQNPLKCLVAVPQSSASAT